MRAAALLFVTFALTACSGVEKDAPQAPPREAVTELDNVLQLRSDFEASKGKTRLLVLFSPT